MTAKKKNHMGLNQEISEAICYYYVDLKLFFQKVRFSLAQTANNPWQGDPS